MATTYFYPKSFYDEMVSFQCHPDALQNIAYFDLGLDEDVIYDRIDVVTKGSQMIARARTSEDQVEFFLAVKFQLDDHSRTTGLFKDQSTLPEDTTLSEFVEIALYEEDLFITRASYYVYSILQNVKYYGLSYTREQILNSSMQLTKVFRHHEDMFKWDSVAYKIPKVVMNGLG